MKNNNKTRMAQKIQSESTKAVLRKTSGLWGEGFVKQMDFSQPGVKDCRSGGQ